MRGNLIIGRNHAFYNINNDLIKVNINGNFNKVVNPFRIKDVYIHGNNNNVEIIGNGEIKILPVFLKFNNNDKCSLCSRPFNGNEKVKIYSCKKHIFHINCLKDFLRNHFIFPLNPPRCPKCNSLNNNNLLNITNEHFFPRNNFNFRIRRPQFRRIFYNDLTNNSRHSAPNLDDSSDDQDFDNFEDEDINSDDDLDLDIKSSNGLNQEIIDNMEISKIKDVEKLDSDKKK